MSLSSLAHAHTEVTKERITYDWSIKGFDLLTEEVNEGIWSPWFYSRDNREKWRLELYPRGKSNSSSEGIDYIALWLHRDSPGKSPLRVHVTMEIIRSNEILHSRRGIEKYAPQEGRGFNKFLDRSKLLATNSSDDQFTIRCIIEIPVEVKTSSFNVSIFTSKKTQLSDDFRMLFEDPVFSDFTIIVGDQKFQTHKNILAKRSSVFTAMFKYNDLEENRKNEVKIKNFEPDVIKGMLEFIYTDQVTNLKELAGGLLEAADKYDLEKLSAMCEMTLYEGLNKENVADVLLLADLHHADTLKKCVMEYIVAHATEVLKSSNWKKIGGNPELLLEFVNHSLLS